MNNVRFYNMMLREEGREKFPYLDTKGIWTIDIGITSINGVKVSQFTPPLTELQSLTVFYEHTFKALNIAMKFVKNFGQLSSIRQEVLVGMAFQMGNDLLDFKKTRKFIEADLFDEASVEMLDSKWHRIDSPNRAVRMSNLFKIG